MIKLKPLEHRRNQSTVHNLTAQLSPHKLLTLDDTTHDLEPALATRIVSNPGTKKPTPADRSDVTSAQAEDNPPLRKFAGNYFYQNLKLTRMRNMARMKGKDPSIVHTRYYIEDKESQSWLDDQSHCGSESNESNLSMNSQKFIERIMKDAGKVKEKMKKKL